MGRLAFKSVAYPIGKHAQTNFGPDMTVPNQALSLEEIVARFTRMEPLAIGKQVNYHESEDDLEKVAGMDPVDKAMFLAKLKRVEERWNDQEARRKAKIEQEERERIAERVRLEEAAKKALPTS